MFWLLFYVVGFCCAQARYSQSRRAIALPRYRSTSKRPVFVYMPAGDLLLEKGRYLRRARPFPACLSYARFVGFVGGFGALCQRESARFGMYLRSMLPVHPKPIRSQHAYCIFKTCLPYFRRVLAVWSKPACCIVRAGYDNTELGLPRKQSAPRNHCVPPVKVASALPQMVDDGSPSSPSFLPLARLCMCVCVFFHDIFLTSSFFCSQLGYLVYTSNILFF